MPYEPHANLIQPADINAYIWRFINLPKFLDMLTTGSLYFTRGDMFDDPYEGMPPDEYMEVVRKGGTNAGSVQHQTRMFHHYRADFFINCWHMSPHESAGMWKLYAGIDAGIAIKSTYSRLQHAFNESKERFYLGLTSYDHGNDRGAARAGDDKSGAMDAACETTAPRARRGRRAREERPDSGQRQLRQRPESTARQEALIVTNPPCAGVKE